MNLVKEIGLSVLKDNKIGNRRVSEKVWVTVIGLRMSCVIQSIDQRGTNYKT